MNNNLKHRQLLTYNHVPLETVEDWLIVCACDTHGFDEIIMKQLVPNVFVVADETIDEVPADARSAR
jgi:hypothetical protein